MLQQLKNIVSETLCFSLVFTEKRLSSHRVPSQFKRSLEQFVRVSIDCSLQPVLFVFGLNHRPINYNMIRIITKFRLQIEFVNLVVNDYSWGLLNTGLTNPNSIRRLETRQMQVTTAPHEKHCFSFHKS